MNAQQATAFALANGAELTIDGRTVNKEREKFALVKPSQPAPQVTAITPPAAAPAAGLSDAAVLALIKASEDRMMAEMKQLVVMLSRQPNQLQPPAEAAAGGMDFIPEYDQKGRLVNVRAVRLPIENTP